MCIPLLPPRARCDHLSLFRVGGVVQSLVGVIALHMKWQWHCSPYFAPKPSKCRGGGGYCCYRSLKKRGRRCSGWCYVHFVIAASVETSSSPLHFNSCPCSDSFSPQEKREPVLGGHRRFITKHRCFLEAGGFWSTAYEGNWRKPFRLKGFGVCWLASNASIWLLL